MSQDTFRKSTFIVIVISMVLVLLQIVWRTNPVKARDEAHNMRTLIENLKQKQKEDPDLYISFQFIHPVIELDPSSTSWEFPYTSNDPDMGRDIGEVGDDYICFDEMRGQVFDTRCVPFSGIANIFYSDF